MLCAGQLGWSVCCFSHDDPMGSRIAQVSATQSLDLGCRGAGRIELQVPKLPMLIPAADTAFY